MAGLMASKCLAFCVGCPVSYRSSIRPLDCSREVARPTIKPSPSQRHNRRGTEHPRLQILMYVLCRDVDPKMATTRGKQRAGPTSRN